MESRIPIQNVYYLLIYAWDRLAEGELVDVSGIDSTELVDLYASILLKGIRHLLRRGLDRSYVTTSSEMLGVRGRIQIAPTIRRMLVQHGRVHCEYDELCVDTLPNRILLATLRRIVTTLGLDKGLRDSVRGVIRSLNGISDIQLNKQAFRAVQIHSNNGFYQFLLSLCELIVDCSLSTEDPGCYRFQDFTRDPAQMARLFERFVLNFYRRECTQYAVARERIYWEAFSEDDPNLERLPTMETDISLRKPGKTIVIDTKFYQQTLQQRYDSQKVYSANLYQLFSYLKNLELRGEQDAAAEGILLYPEVNKKLRLRYEIAGHSMRVCTLDLAQPWINIRQELHELVA